MKAIWRVLYAATALFASRLDAAKIDDSFQATPPERLDFLVTLTNGVVGATSTALYKFDHSGQRDFGFGPTFPFGFVILALERDAAGRILVGGELAANNNTGILYRLLPNGNLDTSFTPVEASSRITAIRELPDSRLLIGGFFKSVNSAPRVGSAVVSENGSLDETFLPTEGSLTEGLAVNANGEYLTSNQGLRRYVTNGTLLAQAEYGDNISFFANDLLDTPDGGLWIGKAFDSAKILVDGAVDGYTNTVWPTRGAATVLPDGRILLAGNDPNRSLVERLVLLFADGKEDTSFVAPAGWEVTAITSYTNGVAYVSGSAGAASFLARFLPYDDATPATIQLNRQVASVGEGNSFPLTLIRDGNVSAPATVSFATTAGTAPATDFAATNGIVNFAPGDRSKTLFIPTFGSDDAVRNRTFEVELTSTVGADLGTNNRVTVTILDRDSGIVTHPEVHFREGAGAVQFTIHRTNGAAYPRRLQWKLQPTNAADTNTFDLQEGIVQFGALATAAHINLRINDDTVAGTNKLFKIALTSLDPDLIITESNTVSVLVLENDAPGNPGRGVDGPIEDAAFYPDGRLGIGGNFRTVNGTLKPRLGRLLSTGEADTNFIPPAFEGPETLIRNVVPLSDGKLVVAGSFTNVGGTDRKHLVRLNQDGSLDNSFDSTAALPREPYAVTALPDGDVLAVGIGVDYNGTGLTPPRPLGTIVRLNESGAKDTNFVTKVSVGTSVGIHITPAPNEGFYLAGDIAVYTNTSPNWSSVGQPARRYLARIKDNGALDTNFNAVITTTVSPGSLSTPIVTSISVDTNTGSVLITGNFSTPALPNLKSLARLNADGSLDRQFMTNVFKEIPTSDSFIDAVLSKDGGAWLIAQGRAGGFRSIFRVNADGTFARWINSDFGPTSVRPGPFWTVSPNGTAVLANTSLGSRLAWFYPDGTPAAEASLKLGKVAVQPNGEIHVQVEGRTTGTLVLQRSTDLVTWEEVARKPLAGGIETVTFTPAEAAGKGFFRAIVVQP